MHFRPKGGWPRSGLPDGSFTARHKSGGNALGDVQVYQGDAGGRVVFALQMAGRFDQCQLQRRADVGFQQMPAPGSAVRFAEDYVGMDLGRALLVQGDVADQRYDLDLLVDRNRLILLPVPLEVAQGGILERADSREMAAAQAVAPRELFQDLHDLVAGVEDEHVGLLGSRTE